MTATKLLNGAWQVSDIVNGFLVNRVYYGYTKTEALAAFRFEMRLEALASK